MEITWTLILWSTTCLGFALTNATDIKGEGGVALPFGVMLLVWTAGVALAKVAIALKLFLDY